MRHRITNFVRYPGSKRRILKYILPFLPPKDQINGMFIEPFVGGGTVFFAVSPDYALLSDINSELIDLYRGIRSSPLQVWQIYESFPSTKNAYEEIRADTNKSDLAYKAARSLYLNRTCFKGMWRHNSKGRFNVGYGGQDRRWVINLGSLVEISERLKYTVLKCSDFEPVIDESVEGDFIFADPPYRPGKRELLNTHYTYSKFTYKDYQRLAKSLDRASSRGVKWALTISSHPEILSLFDKVQIIPLPRGTGEKPGILTANSGEVLIFNYSYYRG